LIKVKSAEEALIGIQRLARKRRHPQEALPPLGEAVEAFKRQHLEEEARLLYVGFTRAMKGLSLTTHVQYRDHFNRLKKTHPTKAFEVIEAYLDSIRTAPVEGMPTP
jgi:ATP-dependent exoDNAse (exonuclease V) beta subunit